MNSSLKARFEQLGPVRDVSRATSGSSVVIAMRPLSGDAALLTVDAALILARHGLTLLRAKRAVEAVMESGGTVVELPLVDDAGAVVTDLAAAGIEAMQLQPGRAIDIRALRDRLGMTREQFALRFGLEVETLRNWETGKREPDTTARSYLRAIANAPADVERAYRAPVA